MKGRIVEMPSMRERVGKMIMAGALAFSMGAGAMAMPMTALAAEQGSVTITAQSGNEVTYNAYQVFKANVHLPHLRDGRLR